MRVENEDYFLNPPPGSAAARAVEFGIDLTLTLENLRLTPEERIRKLDDLRAGIAELKANARPSSSVSTAAGDKRLPKGVVGQQIAWLAEAGIDYVVVDAVAGALQGSSNLVPLLAVCHSRKAASYLTMPLLYCVCSPCQGTSWQR
jgi:hypothetical protein